MKETHRPPVGRIGLQREKFLQENHSLLYDKMLLDGTLYSDLKQTEQRYWEQVEQTITKLLVSNPAPDKNPPPGTANTKFRCTPTSCAMRLCI